MLPLGQDVSQAGVVQGVELVQVRWAGNRKLGGKLKYLHYTKVGDHPDLVHHLELAGHRNKDLGPLGLMAR